MKPVWHNCPLCGSPRVVKKTGELTVKTRNGQIRIPRVWFHECGECKQRFYDYEASKIVDEYCLERTAARKK